MYHPTRGGVRGGRDQFTWDDVKVDKHRENYMGHSIKAPVGRWQKGKDLHWYAKERNGGAESDAMKEEIRRIKEDEEQSMREALGLAPKRSTRPQGSRLDKHEYSELVKRTSTAEDLGAGHAEAAWVHGIGYAKAPRPWEEAATLASKAQDLLKPQLPAESNLEPVAKPTEVLADEKKRKHEEGKYDDRKRDKREKNEKKRHRDSNFKKHDSDYRKNGSDYKKHRRNKER